jgi:selenide,water dikinase
VDDPYAYGAIAAANSLSDIYAMGADPLFALNILAFPCGGEPHEGVLREILRGGAEKAREAGIAIVGGHSVRDAEPKYGLCVVGRVHPGKLISAEGARPGDALVLTKPLGTGVVTTAIKRRTASRPQIKQAVNVMSALNSSASFAMRRHSANACTDVTGYGLLGHLRTILVASRMGAEIWAERVPLLDGALAHAQADCVPGGSKKNLAWAETFTRFSDDVSPALRTLLADAQTSGGLLIAVPRRKKDALLRALRRSGTPAAAEVGRIVKSSTPALRVSMGA